MGCYDFLVIGSGPAGAAAALQLAGRNVCVVDVGDDVEDVPSFTSLPGAFATEDAYQVYGGDLDYIANALRPQQVHSKVRSPFFGHVMRGERYTVTDAAGKTILSSYLSHALGGMANVWGGQLYRFNQQDLLGVGGWPITAAQLDPFYEELESHIGICGENDDMALYLGESSSLQAPPPLVPTARYLYNRYRNTPESMRRGLTLGRPRLGLLTSLHRGRPAHSQSELDFLAPDHGLYSPKSTIQMLLKQQKIGYLGGTKVRNFEEKNDRVQLSIIDTRTQEQRTIFAKQLLIACGTLQSTKLVLQSLGEKGRSLPFMDHPPALLPIFFPSRMGTQLPRKSYPIQLAGTVANREFGDMISFYYPAGLPWSNLLLDFPLPFSSSLRVMPVLLSGTMIAQVWERVLPSPWNVVSLAPADSTIDVSYAKTPIFESMSSLVKALRCFGGYTHTGLVSVSPPTWGFHHAGTMPMRKEPKAFETHIDGRLKGHSRVRIVDGSVFPSLPAKNLSFTIMANASRIAADLLRT